MPRAEEKLGPVKPQGGVFCIAWVVVPVRGYSQRGSHAPQGADVDVHLIQGRGGVQLFFPSYYRLIDSAILILIVSITITVSTRSCHTTQCHEAKMYLSVPPSSSSEGDEENRREMGSRGYVLRTMMFDGLHTVRTASLMRISSHLVTTMSFAASLLVGSTAVLIRSTALFLF